MPGSPTAASAAEAPARRAGASPLSVPVRGSSVVTGVEHACRAELVGFASPIGRLSAVLHLTQETTRKSATWVVPLELPVRTEGAETAELTIPPSDVRVRELRVETPGARLRLSAAKLREELALPEFDGMPPHRQAVVLATALSRGALAWA